MSHEFPALLTMYEDVIQNLFSIIIEIYFD